jgi:hypothetical protein
MAFDNGLTQINVVFTTVMATQTSQTPTALCENTGRDKHEPSLPFTFKPNKASAQ